MTPGGACFECGQPAEHQHHVVPRARGGTKTVPLCGECHDKAHDMSLGALRRAAWDASSPAERAAVKEERSRRSYANSMAAFASDREKARRAVEEWKSGR